MSKFEFTNSTISQFFYLLSKMPSQYGYGDLTWFYDLLNTNWLLESEKRNILNAIQQIPPGKEMNTLETFYENFGSHLNWHVTDNIIRYLLLKNKKVTTSNSTK